MANVTYSNPDRYKYGNQTRFKVNNDMLRIMAANPWLGAGYILGNALGEERFGKQRAKTAEYNYMNRLYGVTKDQFNQYYKDYKGGMSPEQAMAKNGIGQAAAPAANAAATPAQQKILDQRAQKIASQADALRSNGLTSGYVKGAGTATSPYQVSANGTDWKAANKAIDDYKNGSTPRRPQDIGQKPITAENAANLGGMTNPADEWSKMESRSRYNFGNTPIINPTGARDLSNVMNPAPDFRTVAANNALYGNPNGPSLAAPKTPAPMGYTQEQLQQIKDYGGFTPEELQRMGANELVAPAASGGGSSVAVPAAGGGESAGAGLLAPVASAVASGLVSAATGGEGGADVSTPASAPDVPAAVPMVADTSGTPMPVNEGVVALADPAPNFNVINTPAASTNFAGGFNDAMRGYGYDPKVVEIANAAPATRSVPVQAPGTSGNDLFGFLKSGRLRAAQRAGVTTEETDPFDFLKAGQRRAAQRR